MVGFESILPKGPNFNRYIFIGLLLGLSGVFMMFGKDLQHWIQGSYLLGVFALMGAVIAWSLGSIYSKYKKISVHPLMGASIQMLIAGALQTLLGLILDEHNNLHLTQNGVLSIAYLVVFGSIFGYPLTYMQFSICRFL